MREALEHQLFGTPPKPVRVGRFVIVDRIGSGGMGTVFGAYDPQLDRRIAIKVLHPQRHSPTEAQRWLSAEARSLARLSHPNVTTVYDVGLADDHLYMAMELVEGGTLARFCQQHDGRGRARTRALVDLMIQACRGLQAAHESGLLHRDLKPGNLLVGDDGRLRIADFGLARTLEPSDTPLDNAQGAPTPPPNPNPNLEATAATQTWAGTPAYMAPEQFRGQATEQSDQFALCVTFFEALCGQRPYPARSVEAQRQRLASGPAEVPPHVTIPTWLMRALLRGLRFEPTERFESIAALRHALERGGRDRRLALIVASGVAATATATLLVGPPPDPCADVHARVQGMWNPTRSEAIARALRAGPEPTPAIVAHQVVEALGRHFEGWGEAAQEICEVRAAAALPPDGLHDDKGDIDPRRACLDRRRGQLEYVRDALERGDPRVVANAEQIVMAVPDPGRCAEIEADEAKVETETLEAARAGLHELAEQLDALKIDLIGGRTGEVVAQGEVLLRQLDERQLYATAAWTGDLVVTAQIGRQDIAAAETAALRSLRAAERAGAPRLLVNAWERLAIVHRIFERFDRAEFALDRARSVLDRERLPQTERGNWLYHRGALRYDQARYEDALADYARAFELHRDRDAKLPAGLLIHHALALFAAGDHAQAFEVVHKKLEQTAQTYGDQHPKYGQDCLVLGTLMVDNGALSAGLERLSRGIEILERYPGHKKAHVAKALATQARALNGLHRPAEAEPLARRAHERLTALPSPHLAAEVEALREQARAHQALGRISEALALYRRALARAEASQRLSGEADALREAITAGEAQLEEPAVAG